jgi:hypothetical protein
MSLLHNVFLIMCVCSICNFGISWKVAGLNELGVYTRICFIMGTNAMETTEMLQVAFQGQTVERTQPFNTFRPRGVYILRGLSSHQSGAL